MFSKQHFEKIAKLIKTSESETKQGFISELVNLFALDNSKFKPEKFFKASGLSEISLLENSKNKTNISISRLSYLCISL
jgi:hypothetical protein